MNSDDAQKVIDLYNEMSVQERMDTNTFLSEFEENAFYEACKAAKRGDMDELGRVAGRVRDVVADRKRKPIKGAKKLGQLSRAMGSVERMMRLWGIVSGER